MEKKSAPGLVVPTAVEDDLDGTNKRKKGRTDAWRVESKRNTGLQPFLLRGAGKLFFGNPQSSCSQSFAVGFKGWSLSRFCETMFRIWESIIKVSLDLKLGKTFQANRPKTIQNYTRYPRCSMYGIFTYIYPLPTTQM